MKSFDQWKKDAQAVVDKNAGVPHHPRIRSIAADFADAEKDRKARKIPRTIPFKKAWDRVTPV